MVEKNNYIYDIHVKMRDNNVLLAYTGELDMKVINALITSVKLKLKEVRHLPRIQKRVYGLMVESLETIHRGYRATILRDKKINLFSIFTLSSDGGYYHLISGNYVFNDNIESRKKQIDRLNALNIEDKKRLYREYISDDNLSEDSSELSMVEMAIKSDNALKYEFKNIDEITSFYIFHVKIKIN